jgi:hypothetical protein
MLGSLIFRLNNIFFREDGINSVIKMLLLLLSVGKPSFIHKQKFKINEKEAIPG